MKLYEIDEKIAQVIAESTDPETGEFMLDIDALNELQMARTEKIENLLLLCKNLSADVEAIGAEIDRLTARKKVKTNEVTRLKAYIMYVLNGEKFETPRVSCRFKRSQKVTLSEQFIEWAKKNALDLLRFKEPEPNKTEIGKRLKEGNTIPYATMEESVSMTIK